MAAAAADAEAAAEGQEPLSGRVFEHFRTLRSAVSLRLERKAFSLPDSGSWGLARGFPNAKLCQT